MTEIIARSKVHIKHRNEGRADDEVEYPLESYGNSHSSTTDGIREKLGNKHPGNRSPGEHKAGTINHDAQHGNRTQRFISKGQGYAQGSYCHADGTEDKQWLAAQLLYRKDSNQRKRDIHNTHDNGLNHRIAHTHILEDTRRIIEYRIDTHSLLEYRKHHAHKDTHKSVREELLGLHGHRILDIVDNLTCLLRTIDLGKHAVCLLILSDHHEITRSLRYEADQEGEQSCRNHLATKHISPARLDGPLRIHHIGDGTRSIIDRIGMGTHYDEIDEVNHQLTEDDGKLIAAHQHTAHIARSDFADIHRTDG